ncbi:unnamed protein product [Ambrosiozyma monospora]|uniref:Unnamed protein product n=1 Tax=Ambrosiozyma monospora TaxID=43982 RepID=A0ACB5T234_AMBMO|nr:unnamed protein product [Ambrosiozyma monospora]
MASKRVVITGMGLITPLGLGVKHNWQKLIQSHSGLISTLDLPNSDPLFKQIPSQVVGAVPHGPQTEHKYDANDHFTKHEQRRYSKFIQYALVATKEALADAQWDPSTREDKLMTGCCIGSGIGSMEDIYNNNVALAQQGYRKVQPLMIPKMLPNMAAGITSIAFGFGGPNHAVSTACATGIHAIGDAARFIKDGYANVMVAGASESSIHPAALAGFARAKSLSSKFNDDPRSASRPFDQRRSGFVMGEGSGIVVLESLEHALGRGLTKDQIHGEVAGYGLSGDAHHITSPDVEGDGAKRAMEFALKQAGLSYDQIGYVNAHATSTVLGDRAENYALKRLFGDLGTDLAVSSTKGAIGHLLGAAGSVEAIFAMLAVRNGVVPPTLNLDVLGGAEGDVDEDFVFDYVPHVSKKKDGLIAAMSNSFGFGGTNASICLKKFDE